MTVNSEGWRYFDQMQFLTPDVGWARAAVRRPSFIESHILMRTIDGGASWQEVRTIDRGLEPGQFYALDDTSAVATDQDRNIVRTDDGGSTWTRVVESESIPTKVLTAWDESHGLRIGDFWRFSIDAVLWTADHRTWQAASMPITAASDFDFLDDKSGWVAASKLLRTEDGGLTWQMVADKFFWAIDFISGRIFAFVDPRIAWGVYPPDLHLSSAQAPARGGSMYVSVTADSGTTKHSSSFDAPGFCDDLAIAAVDAKHAWLLWRKCDNNQATLEVERTVDGGQTWESMASLPLQDIFNAKFFDSSSGIAAALQCDGEEQCQEVLLRTTDGGATWNLEPTGIVTKRTEDVLFWSPPIGYQFLDPQHIWRMGRVGFAAVEEIYSYDASAAPPSSIVTPAARLGPVPSTGGAPPSSIVMPPAGRRPDSPASKALDAALAVAIFGSAVLMLARFRGKVRP
jgi:photosystem II stability/assembly factor-like uncharacterized protein